jgi:helix-hairpin-helix protein
VSWGERVPPAPPQNRWRLGTILWALLPLLTWGLLAPVPFVHAAVRLRTVQMWLVAAFYTIVWLAVGPAGVLVQNPDVNEAVQGFSQLGLVVAATTHAFVLRERVFPTPGPPAITGDPVVAAALAARQRREQARAITTRDPALARELRIGRPDLPRQFDDGGLVDVNQVPVQVLVDRLGLSQAEAERVVETRDRLGRFTNPAELAVYAELPEATVEAVRDRLLFLGGGTEP